MSKTNKLHHYLVKNPERKQIYDTDIELKEILFNKNLSYCV